MNAFNPDTTAVMVIDMQNDFAHPDGALYTPQSEAIIDDINDLVMSARNAGAEVIFTKDTHSVDQFDGAYYYDEFDQWGEHVVEGSWGAELHEDIDVREEDYVVDKHTYDAFSGTDLNEYLIQKGVKDIIFCGTLANVCVLHTAGSAGLRDYLPVLVEDALGYIEEDHRDYAVTHADWLFGEVTERAEVAFDT